MKQLTALFFTLLILASCKKEEPIDTTEPLTTRILGTWQVTGIQYNGIAPNPFDPTQSVVFSGAGKNVEGHFKFEADTNLGEFEIKFIGEADLGLAAPVSYNVAEKRTGIYAVVDNDKIVRMTNFAGDSVYNWEVRVNQPNKQVWYVLMIHDSGIPGFNALPINVEATMER